jgi:PAS domain S-box-containing protein
MTMLDRWTTDECGPDRLWLMEVQGTLQTALAELETAGRAMHRQHLEMVASWQAVGVTPLLAKERNAATPLLQPVESRSQREMAAMAFTEIPTRPASTYAWQEQPWRQIYSGSTWLEYALETAQLAIWEWDLLVDAMSWSNSFETLHGLAPGGFAGTYEALLALIHPDDQQHFDQALTDAIERNGSYEIEFRIIRPDGSSHWVAGRGRALHNDDGEIVGIISALNEISARKRHEEHLRQAQKLESLGRLVGGVAHDFNNLLAAIGVYADLALEQLPAAGPGAAELHDIQHTTALAVGLTRQLLAFARDQPVAPHLLNLNELVAGMDKLLRCLLGEGIELRLISAADLGWVKGDPGRIEQLIINLAINARDAIATRQSGRLSIETANVTIESDDAHQHVDLPAGEYVLLTISDTGCGMDAATQARIFEPFFTTKAPGAGTGLGLATCREIVCQHGGAIQIHSELDWGSVVMIYLPRAA